ARIIGQEESQSRRAFRKTLHRLEEALEVIVDVPNAGPPERIAQRGLERGDLLAGPQLADGDFFRLFDLELRAGLARELGDDLLQRRPEVDEPRLRGSLRLAGGEAQF